MTKTTTKPNAAAPQSAPSAPLMVLGYDEDQKPRGARFQGADSNLVAKAAQLMDLKVYEATTEELAALAKKLPLGRLSRTFSHQVSTLTKSLMCAASKNFSPPNFTKGMFRRKSSISSWALCDEARNNAA